MTTTTAPTLTPDADLLRRYAASGSPDAFAVLADRYLPLIYSAAVRQTRDAHLAEDVAQATLIILSQKAARLDPAHLPGWLLKTTHYAARNATRERSRRASYERRAASMKPESHAPTPSADPDDLSRVLDPALASLGDADRTAVVLRYLQGSSFADIAAHLRTTEIAAQRRVARAVHKLREILTRQGVTVTPAALPALLTAQTLHTVPPSLALQAASLSPKPIAALIAKGAAHAMTAAKMKLTAAVAATVLLAGVAVPTAFHYATARATPTVDLLPPGTDPARPVAGSLPPGLTAEPLAVMSLADNRWIRPNGGDLADLPDAAKKLDPARTRVLGATHALLFRLQNSDPAVSWSYSLQESGMYGSNSIYDAKTHSQYSLIVFAPRAGARAVTLTIAAASGPWTRDATIPASATTPTLVRVANFPITFGPPTQVNDVVRVKRTMPGSAPASFRERCAEFYAVDAAGKKIPSVAISTASTGRYATDYEFKGPLSNFNEFHLDSRPYNYHATYPPIPLPRPSDGAALHP